MEWYKIIVGILTGLAVAIPLVAKLVEYVTKAVREKNWGNVLALVIKLMQEAEEKFDNGADRRTWVLEMIEASADVLNYDIDLEMIGNLIDMLCAMAKKINVQKIEE